MGLVLLSRDGFREGVFARDKHTCVHCGRPGVDAHHIMERRLFPDGGYYLSNGVTLCADCHLKAEQTLIDCPSLRREAGILEVVLPPHLATDEIYDKWGNPVLPSGVRLRGELFDEEPVQKALQPVLHLFTTRVKYPRTFHFAQSPGAYDDDKKHTSTEQWSGLEVVVTEKLDGENTSFYRDYMHARSLDYEPHPSRSFIKALWGQIAHDIPEGFRICGENVTATHSIKYTALPAYFFVFNIWESSLCLSWDETVEYAELLGLSTVPVLYKGMWHNDLVKRLSSTLDLSRQEGFVLRPRGQFHLKQFPKLVGKWVRKGHVQTSTHWKLEQVHYNQLNTRR